MKLFRRFTLVVIATVTGLSSLFVLATPAYASPGTVYFTPGSGRFDPGSTFTIDVRTTVQNPGTILGGARVAVTYPANMVSVESTSTSGNSMGGSVSKTTGQLSYSAVVAPPRHGNGLLLFRVTFKALARGNFTLNFTSASQVNDGPTTKQSSTYSIQPASCPSGQVGTPPNCSTPPKPTPAPTPTPTPAPSPKPPTPAPTPTPSTDPPTQTVPEPSPDASTSITPIQTDADDLSIKDVSTKPSWQGNTITWASSLPDVTSTIEIGTSKDELKAGPEVTKQEDGSYIATPKDLSPGTRYYYLITAVSNTDAMKKATYSGAITTRGYPVMLVVNQDGAPLQGAKIAIDKGNYVTDKSGAVFLELANKSYAATITGIDDASKNVTFAVAKKDIPLSGSDPEMQKFSFGITPEDTASETTLPIGLIAGSIAGGLALIGGFFLFLLYRRRRNEQLAVPVAIAEDYSWTQEMQPAQYTQTTTQDYGVISSDNSQQIDEVPSTEQPNLTAPPEQQIDSYFTDNEQLYAEQSATLALNELPAVESVQSDQPDPYQDTSPATNSEPATPEVTVPVASSFQEEELPREYTEITPPDPLYSPVNTEQEERSDNKAEPGATYDPSTGELNIIHHHATSNQIGGTR